MAPCRRPPALTHSPHNTVGPEIEVTGLGYPSYHETAQCHSMQIVAPQSKRPGC